MSKISTEEEERILRSQKRLSVMLRNLGQKRFADDSNCTIGPPDRYFVSMYTDGPSTRWNVIDRQTQEWVRRFPTEAEARAYADELSQRAS
jgi:hypothetical protein